MKLRTHIFNKMTAAEVEAYLARGGDAIFLAVGVVECHGALPNDVETVIAEAFATLLAEKADGLSLINLPYFYPGGTFSSNATVHVSIKDGIDYLDKICTSLVAQGFRRIFLVSAHGPSGLTIDAFCRDFFEKTLVHPCHLNGMAMMAATAAGQDIFSAAGFERLSDITYGAYKVMNQIEYLPVDPGASEKEAPRKETEPDMANFAEALRPFGGRVSQIYSDPDEHGGGRLFKSGAERLAACEQGEVELRGMVEKLDICGLKDALGTYQAYAKRMAAKIPRLQRLV